MAIVGGQDDEELNGQGKPSSGGEGGFVSGGSGQGATTKPTAGAAAPTNSGGYTNLNSYLQANEGSGSTTGRAAENIVDQAGSTAKGAQGAYRDSATKDISDATAKVGFDKGVVSKINAGAATFDPNLEASIQGGIAKTDKSVLDAISAGGSGTEYTGPTTYDTDYKGPMAATAAQYAGPSAGDVHVSWDPTKVYQSGTTDKQGKAEAANKSAYDYASQANAGHAGVSGLLRTAYQQPSYTAGENNLDAFLAGGTQGGRQALSQATGVAAGVEGGYKNIGALLGAGMNTGKSTAENTNSAYDSAINAATARTGSIQKSIDAAIAKAKGDHSALDAYGQAVGDAKTKAMTNKIKAEIEDSKARSEAAQQEAERQAAEQKVGINAAEKVANLPGEKKTHEVAESIGINGKPTPINANVAGAGAAADPYIQPGYNPLSAAGVPQPDAGITPRVDSALDTVTHGNYSKLRKKLHL